MKIVKFPARMANTKWLYPGMRVKRWLFMAFIGSLLATMGLAIANEGRFFRVLAQKISELDYLLTGADSPLWGGLLLAFTGLTLMAFGVKKTVRSILAVVVPNNERRLVDLIYTNRNLKRGPKIVVIGGGTGLSVLLRGLKAYTSNITAVVTVADDGGSSGRLRGDFGILPPGDIRNCLVALADKESLMEDLFQHRFKDGTDVAGHNLGNLLIAAMSEISGDFKQAIQRLSKVLAIRGQVLPSTLTEVVLAAETTDGEMIIGESNIPAARKSIKRVYLQPHDCLPVEEALTAIAEADAIILGPGSLYTSILPNLLIKGIPEAIRNSPALKAYVCNIMTQPGETDRYSASQHVRAIIDHVGPGLMDHVIVNVEEIPKKLVKKYKEEGAYPVQPDIRELEKLGVKAAQEMLVFETDLVRHHPDKLSRAIMSLIFRLKSEVERAKFMDIYLGSERNK